MCAWIWRPETFSLVQFLTVPQIISRLRQKASPRRNQPHKGVDVRTVLRSKSYWHFHPTAFLPNAHSGRALPHTGYLESPGRAVYHLTAQNLEGFAPAIKLILNYCCSKLKTTGGTSCLHSSAKHLDKLYTPVGNHFL